MSKTWDRRTFLTTVVGAVPALAVSARAAAALPRTTSNGLPPRVIGLRTDGGNFRFDPAGLVVEPASGVVWLNMGDFHSTTAFHPDNANLIPGKMPRRIPEGATSWHSGMLGLMDGTEFAHTFEVEGVYDYFCQPHYMFGMVGRVVAGEPRGGPGTLPMDGLPDIVQQKMPPLDVVTGAGARPNEWASRLNGVLYVLAGGEDASSQARAVQTALAADGALRKQSDTTGNTAAIAAATGTFVEAVQSGVDYERLVALADGVKAELTKVIG